MEALVFHYFSTATSSLCTCAAVIAAALSLWLLRSFNPKPTTSPSPHLPPPSPSPAPPPLSVATPLTPVSDGLTKGRFIAYFNADEDSNDSGVDGECDIVSCQWSMLRPLRAKEGVVRRSGGDPMGWYRYQDRSVINGSVVRLWDGERVLSSAVRV